VGRVEERRLRDLERRALEAARQVASMRLHPDDLDALAPYLERVLEADAAVVERPRPTPEEEQAFDRWAAETERAFREGWGRPDPPPGLGRDDYFG
jgi:hypothetical protein